MRMPGTLLTIWLVRPCPMNPAPIIPTRTGLPCSSRALRALSTMIIASSLAPPALQLWLDLLELLPRRVLGRDFPQRQRPRQPQARVGVVQPAFRARRVELAHLVAGLGAVLEHLVAVREPLRHVERAVVVGGQLHRHVLQI